MSDVDQSNLEADLRRMFESVGEQAPLLGPVRVSSKARSRRSRIRGLSLGVAAAAAVTTIAVAGQLVGRSSGGDDHAGITPAGPSAATSPGATISGGDDMDITGTWKATQFRDLDLGAEHEVEYDPLITFNEDGTLQGFDSCIGFQGSYIASDAGDLEIVQVDQRLVGCSPHYPHPVEATYFEILNDGAELRLWSHQGGELLATYERSDGWPTEVGQPSD